MHPVWWDFFCWNPKEWSWKCFDQVAGVSGFPLTGEVGKVMSPWPSPLLLPRSTLSSSSSESVLWLELGSCQKRPLGILDSISLLWMQISIWHAKALLFIGHSHEKHIIYNMIWYVMHVDTHSAHNNRFTVSYQGLWCTCSTSRRFRSRLGAHAASRVPETFPTPKKKKLHDYHDYGCSEDRFISIEFFLVKAFLSCCFFVFLKHIFIT